MADIPLITPNSTRKHHAARRVRFTSDSVEDADGACTSLPLEAQVNAIATIRTSTSTLRRQPGVSVQLPSGRSPPKYDELYPPSPASASRSLVKARPSPPPGMDPLVAAMWHNENLSLLHSLPKPLLIKIISSLSNSGVDCLRRVARRFPPLCVREVLSPLRGNNPELSKTGPLNWPTFGVSSSLRPDFLYLIDRDEYCSGCQAARRSPRWEQTISKLTEYIHCSACGADHPACLFSATQRLKPARIRYCIGHEGFMRVCEHDEGTVSLSRLSGLESEDIKYRRYPWQRKDPFWETVICRDRSHYMRCEMKEGGSFPESGYTCGSRQHLCCGYRWPTICGLGKNPRLYDLSWKAHISFDGQMSTLRPKLAELHDITGKYIIPCLYPTTQPPTLRCFDPNDCHCTPYAGSENVRWEWECGPWLPGITECMEGPYKGLDTLRPPKASGSIVSNIISRLKKQPPRECAADQKRHMSRQEVVPFKWGVAMSCADVRPCHTGKDCLKIDYIRVLHPLENGNITPEWYNTLDPESYNITEDEDGLGVFWCPTDGCRNFYKEVLSYSRILRHRDFRKECRHRRCE
ncbi:hypothetical protein KVR01_008272 [Diaporthe batatas]|uniref:uncharacterized protein n=1 Tax=Diaporthe batatas TaxID=748121 RepID=UPI001D0403F9|nr:uncharacterized protein KVR01_008272 [Diaporthe batatas]KAG8162507.1 hypothetical protein KVR01_008272 [Diaporthe batatas]